MRRVLLSISVITLLVGCDEQTPKSEQQAARVDPAKIEKIMSDFHLHFFDENGETILLNDAEIGVYDAGAPDRRKAMAPPRPPAGGWKGDLAKTYTERCEMAGVPIFPKLPLKSPPWQKRKNLPKGSVFNAPDYQPVEVWSWTPKDKSGVCVALPRYNKDDRTKIQEIGFICQNEKTGKACFWAAHDITSGDKLMKAADLAGKGPAQLEGGDQLKLNCTECHRGYNVFITHPATSLGKVSQDPDKRYMPVMTRQKGWVNGEPVTLPSVGSDGGCAFCHEFATPTKKWCETVLKPSIGKTMPVFAGETKVIPRTQWSKKIIDDLKHLEKLCKEAELKGGLMLNLPNQGG